MATVAEPIERHAPAAHAAPAPREFQIVPRAGIPIVVVVVGGLIAAIASNSLWALEFFHVSGGAAWTAIDLFLGLLLGPIIGSMPVPARVELTTRLMPKMVLLMPTLVIMTLGAGFQLARKVGNLSAASPAHGWIVASMIVVGVMATIALGMLEPANIAVLFELRKPKPNPARIERLMKIFIYTAGITGLMQIATLVIMTKIASLP
jgi:hypothetical protein